MRNEMTRTPHPHIIQAMGLYKGYPFVRVYDEVSFEDHAGRLCTELEASKMLQVDLRTLPLAHTREWHAWVPLLQVVHQGVLSVFGYLSRLFPTSESQELLSTPSEGERVRGWSRVIPNMLQLSEHPDGGAVELHYFTSTTYAERLGGVLHMGEITESQRVDVGGHPWLCLVQNLAPMVREMVQIAHEIGE